MMKNLLLLLVLLGTCFPQDEFKNIRRIVEDTSVVGIFPDLIDKQVGFAMNDSVMVLRYQDTVYTVPFYGTDSSYALSSQVFNDTIDSLYINENNTGVSEGLIKYNDQKTLIIGHPSGVRQEACRTLLSTFIAQETIVKGQALYVDTTVSTTNAGASLASASSYNENWIIGIAANSADSGQTVEFMQKGVVEGYSTTGLNRLVPLYVGCGRGEIVDQRPAWPCKPIVIGAVIFDDAVNGVLGVNVRFDDYKHNFDGCIVEEHDYSIVVSGTAVYVDVEKLGGGDLPVQLSSNTKLLNCTTGSGVGGTARIELIQGTPTDPQFNIVYIDLGPGGIPRLQVTTTYPPVGAFAIVGNITIGDYITVSASGAWANRRTTSAIAHGGNGQNQHIIERLGIESPKWWRACTPTAAINAVPTPDLLDLTSIAGEVYQTHKQTWPELQVSIDSIYVANGTGGAGLNNYTGFANLTELCGYVSSDLARNTNCRGQLVVFGAINKTTGECKLYANLPSGLYGGNEAGAYSDPLGTADYTVPADLRLVAFLIARVPYDLSNTGNTIEFINPLGSDEIINLLGNPIGVSGGASGTGSFIPSFQQVTDVGASTINPISVTASGVEAITIGDGSWIGTNSIAGSMYVTSGTNPGDGTHLYLDDAIATLTYSGGASIDVTSTTASVSSPGVGGSSFSVSDAIAAIESGSANIFVNNNDDITCTNIAADYALSDSSLVITKDILVPQLSSLGISEVLSNGSNASDQPIVNVSKIGVGTDNPLGSATGPIVEIQADGDLFPLMRMERINAAVKINRAWEYFLDNNGKFFIRDATAGETRYAIDISGNHGFGTSSPVEKMHLKGTSVAGGKIFARIENLTTDGYSGIEYRNELGNYWQTSISGSTAAINPNGYNLFNSQSGLSLEVDNAGKHTIHATGQLLTLNDESATGNPLIGFSQDGIRRSYIQHLDGGDDLAFVSEVGGQSWYTGGSEKMSLSSSGDLGVGITDPVQKFHIHQPTTGTSTVKFTNNVTGTGIFDGTTLGMINNDLSLVNYEAGNTIFYTNSLERARISSTGNFGVGATLPQAKSHISDGIITTSDWVPASTGSIVAGQEAIEVLVSTDQGTWGSRLAMMQVDGTTKELENAWSMERETNGDGLGDGSLHIKYGTLKESYGNPSIIEMNTGGVMFLPEATNAEILAAGNQAAVTVGYSDANYDQSGFTFQDVTSNGAASNLTLDIKKIVHDAGTTRDKTIDLSGLNSMNFTVTGTDDFQYQTDSDFQIFLNYQDGNRAGNGYSIYDTDNNQLLFVPGFNSGTPSVSGALGGVYANSCTNTIINNDISGKILTTAEWVNSVLPVDSSISSDAATFTLTSDHVFLKTFGANNQTITLPAANARGAGIAQTFTIKNLKSGGTCTLQRAGTDDLYLFGSPSTTTNTSVSTGASIHLVSDGVSAWYVVG